MLAAGLIVVAHNSAGPKQDIIKDDLYLAESKQDYVDKIRAIIEKDETTLIQASNLNRKKAMSFGEEEFERQFMTSI